MARLGSVAAAPFVGDQFASLYLGETRVPTVPGKPPTLNVPDVGGGNVVVQIGVPNDGGSEITDYRVYVDSGFVESGTFEDPELLSERLLDVGGSLPPGASVTASAVNGIGEGPRSAPVTVT